MAGSGQEMANVNFSRYSSAVFKVAQREVWRVFDWLHCHHHRHQPQAYVGQHLRESEGGMKRIGAKERAALERQDDPATMDIPLLYRLLQHTCGLRRDGPDFDWTSPSREEQQQSLEHQLYLIKEARNSLCHHPDQYMHLSDCRLDILMQELTGLLCHSLQQAGQRSAQLTEEVEAAMESVRDRLAHIQASMPPSAILPQEFALLARREMQERWEGFSSRGQQLSPPLLRWALGAQEVTLDQLLQGPGGEEEKPPQVLAVLGETGIGKSSLCWQVVEAWLQGEAGLGEAAAAVEVVVLVEWREVFTRDLTRLLLTDLLPQTCRSCHPEEVLSLLGVLRVLWLLDGFEEASPDARELLRRLVSWCSRNEGSHVVVITCQPDYREELDTCLAPAATPCYVTHCGLTDHGFQSLLATLLQDGQEAAGEATEGRVEAGGENREKEAKGEGTESREESGREEAGGEGKVKQTEQERKSSKEVGVEARRQAFLKEVVALDLNLLKELVNPLKLVLAVQLWEEGRLREAAGASLTCLYAAIQEALVAKLVARLRTKSWLTEAEARERVKQWVAGLCGAALAMWGQGCFVALDEGAEQVLRERAINLLLPYADCFSTFLVCRGGPGPKYRFLHHTQQRVLAAQHLHALLLQGHTTQELMALLVPGQPTTTTTNNNTAAANTTATTTTIDTATVNTRTKSTTTATADVTAITAAIAALAITTAAATTPTTMDHFQGILVLAAASLAAEGSLSEGRARVLAELLEQCQDCPWVEVVHLTACCLTMAREVRPRLTEVWKVNGRSVQAATVLAGIRAPIRITIEFPENPDNLPHIMPLLHCLAKAPVEVALHSLHSIIPLWPPSPCDSLLLPLCDPTSRCCLISFCGALTAEGCQTLRQQQHNLTRLTVGVLEPATLEEVIQLTHNTECLQEVRIYLYNIFKVLPSKPVSNRVDLHLYLLSVEDKEAEDAAILVRRISHFFKSIMLGITSPSTVCCMVRAFRKVRVRTHSLGRTVWIHIINHVQHLDIHFFPLPLPTNVSLTDVYMAWNSLAVQVSMEVKVPPQVARHSTDTGTTAGVGDGCSSAGRGAGAGP